MNQGLQTVSWVQTILMRMMITSSPVITYAWQIFFANAVIMMLWDMMKAHRSHRDPIEALVARAVQFVIYSNFLTFWTTPVPVIGYSFVSAVTENSSFMMSVFDDAAFSTLLNNLDTLWNRVDVPNLLSGMPFVSYCIFMVLIMFLQFMVLFLVAGSMVITAMTAIVGPWFLSWSMFDPLSWLWKGWFKFFISISFVPVGAQAGIYFFANFFFEVSNWAPDTITIYQYGEYLSGVIAVLGMCILVFFSIPFVVMGWFSGHMHGGGPSWGSAAGGVKAALR